MGGLINNLAAWVADVIHSLGYIGVAALIALENLFPPIPSELILPLAGFLAGQGRFSFVGVLVAATIGSLVGAVILYGLGHAFGRTRVRRFIHRHGTWFLLEVDDVDRAEDWFERHGGRAVLIGRVIPVVRSLVSIPAGVAHMGLGVFLLYTAAGSAAWNTILIAAGWWLGERWRTVQTYAHYFEYIVIAAAVLAVVWFVWKRMSGRRT